MVCSITISVSSVICLRIPPFLLSSCWYPVGFVLISVLQSSSMSPSCLSLDIVVAISCRLLPMNTSEYVVSLSSLFCGQ